MFKTVYEFTKSVHSSVSKPAALEYVSISSTSKIEVSVLWSSLFEKLFIITQNEAEQTFLDQEKLIPFHRGINKLSLTTFLAFSLSGLIMCDRKLHS